MNFFELLNFSKIALSKENEFELNYFLSKKNIDVVIYEDKKKTKLNLKGVFFQSLIFFFRIFSNITFFEKKISSRPIYAAVGSINQFNSIKSTLKALETNGDEFLLSISKNEFKEKNYFKDSKLIKFNIKVLLCSITLFLSRALPLYLKLKKMNKNYEISMHFNLFCEAYVLVPYYLDILKNTKPKIIIVSNDHHVINRSLRLSAEILGIKTIYLQHASVSEIFPPLEFNYALLDGEVANQSYIKCYQAQKKINPRIEKNISNCEVLLSGQKKIVINKNYEKKNLKGLHIGLAVNPDDDFDYLQKLLNDLSKMNIKCIVRTHQGQSRFFLKKLKKYIEDKDWIRWSDSREELISDYFMQSNLLIASNSSIHLEAALAGLPTFYYELTNKVFSTDYYGYVKNGISKKLKNNFTFELLHNLVNSYQNDLQLQRSIRNYSETFGTLWQNREGELTALIINRIINDKSLDDLFKTNKSKIYKSIKYLK